LTFGKKMRRVFRFAGGSVQFDLPVDWGDVCNEHSISFSSPSRDAALTVTVHDEPRLLPEEIDRITAEKSPFGVPLSEKQSLSIPFGSGYAQEFEKLTEDCRSHWLAHFLFFDHVTVIASVNGSVEALRDHRVAFKAILSSVTVSKSK
jgi:hypothetical protein